MHNNRMNVYWAVIVISYTFFHLFFVSTNWGVQSVSDSGFFSILTIVIVSVALIQLLRTAHLVAEIDIKLPLYALAYVILIYALREADFHRLFTDEHVTRLKFYTDPNISLNQKLLGGIPLAIFFICLVYLLTHYTKFVLAHLIRKSPWAISVFLWALVLFVSQLIDKSALNRIYSGYFVEEMLELGAAGYLLIAVLSSTKALNVEKGSGENSI